MPAINPSSSMNTPAGKLPLIIEYTIDTAGNTGLACTAVAIGTRAGYVIVPVYLHQPLAPVALPNRQLVGMEKRFLQPQETQTLTIKIDRQFLTYIDGNYQRQPLKGKLSFVTGEETSLLKVQKEI